MLEVQTSAMCRYFEYAVWIYGSLHSRWLITIIRTIGYSKLNPITLLEDHQSCIQYSKNNTDHDKSKHIDIKYNLVREQVQQGNISVAKIPTQKNVADLLTKPKYMVTYFGSIYLLIYLLSMTRSKFEDPRSLLLLRYLYICTDADVYMDGRFRSNNVNVLFFVCLFWEFLQLQHIVFPHQIGVATQGCQLALKGVSWTDSSVIEDSTLIPTLSNLVC